MKPTNADESVWCAIHGWMLDKGFKAVNEENWNSDKNAFVGEYIHKSAKEKSQEVLVTLKGLKIGKSLELFSDINGDTKHIAIKVPEVANAGDTDGSLFKQKDASKLFKDLHGLLSTFEKGIGQQAVTVAMVKEPEKKKEKEKEKARDVRDIDEPLPDSYTQPSLPARFPGYDPNPLQIPNRRRDPLFGGGELIGPGDFQGLPRLGRGGRGGMAPRFDPFGPFPGPGSTGDPDADHLRRPGPSQFPDSDDWYS